MKILRIIFFATCLMVSGCSYNVDIRMTLQDHVPIFNFRYTEWPEKPVKLFSISIMETETGNLVWQVATYDPEVFFKKEDGKVIMRDPSELPKEAFNAIEVADLPFGTIPSGFQQFFPAYSESPVLKPNVRYTIYASGGAGSGRLTFILPEFRGS